MHERTVDIGPTAVRYLEAGAGRPLVLLHGFPLTADLWRPQLERPPHGWRVLAPDLRGLGPSASAPAETLDQMACDVLAWLDALRIERAALGGLSMGGYVVFAMYRMAPDRFTALVLANTRASADTAEGRQARDAMAARVRQQGPTALADAMLPKLLGERARRQQPALEATVRGLAQASSAEGLAGALQAMRDRPDSTPLLREIGVPALVVAGADDAIIPLTEAEEMARRLPRAQLVVLRGAGHLSSLEKPDDFSEALGTFLR